MNNKKRSLGCVIYELVALEKAFPFGFLDEAKTPKPDFGRSILFRALLEEYK